MNSPNNEPKKHINFTVDEIDAYLVEFKKLVSAGKYTISLNENRTENKEFMEDYNIDTEKEIEILLSLGHLHFCYAVDNTKPAFAHEKLYVFCIPKELYSFGEVETVQIYTKINQTKTRKGDDFAVIISFHKLNKKISYLFNQ